MPGFADSFWSSDYAAGLGVLFGKLQQGVQENRQVLAMARMRAEAEEAYGQRLGEIVPSAERITGGFSKDDGATARKAFDGMQGEMQDAARTHQRMAQSIRDLVVNPFSRWCDAHEDRIQSSQDELHARLKAHDNQIDVVKKLRSNYFNKCRLVEDLEEEEKLGFQGPDSSASPSSNHQIPEIKVQPHKELIDDMDEELFEIGDEVYQPEQMKKILTHLLTTVTMGETKVPILGTYINTSAGSDIVEYLQRSMGSTSVSHAERIGQDLISSGLLRLVGNVGSTFANSSKMHYQWRPKAFKLAGLPEKKMALSRTFSMPSNASDGGDSPVVSTVSEYLERWNMLPNQHPNETPAQRLHREAREADTKYKTGVRRLDELRCELEEAVTIHLKFLERCELDRLKAVKTVILDFSGTLGNVIPSLQSTVDKMVLFQETIQPESDLRYLLENYRTGSFVPNVVVYENYYNKADEQTFGVDLEQRARADKKRVPIIVTAILTYLDHHYPELEGDEARRGVWLVDVPLAQTHKLRALVNDGKSFSQDVFSEFDIPTVASLLRLYFLELPDSLVSSHVYEIIRTIYTSASSDASDASRIAILQQALSQLRLTNIATLDACMNHFTRLIELTSADEEYVSSFAMSIAPCVLRPRQETSLTLEEKHSYKLVRDLLAHKDPIFSELKRQSTLAHSNSVSGGAPNHASVGLNAANRPRAISTDESNRKALMEERNKALLEKASASRGRAVSPGPSPRGHRRDRSTGGPETRFPIQVASPTSSNSDRQRLSLGPTKRASLEVPGADGIEADANSTGATVDENQTPEKGHTRGRSTTKFVGGQRISVAPTENAVAARGVTLEDRPMED